MGNGPARRLTATGIGIGIGLAVQVGAWVGAGAVVASCLGRQWGVVCGGLGIASVAAGALTWEARETRRWRAPCRRLAAWLGNRAHGSGPPLVAVETVEMADLVRALEHSSHDADSASFLALRDLVPRDPAAAAEGPSGEWGSLTRSAMYQSLAGKSDPAIDLSSSGDFSTLDMVNRLDLDNFRWIDSSPAEQAFLGWSREELRRKSFLEIVHPDDRNLAWEQLQAALVKGEAHGLIYRIQTARREPRAIEMNVSLRYGSNLQPSHLRCHITDVTDKLRAERELRRRTRELTRVNEELRKTNRALAELKDRYSDLYQNAPAMYFSLDQHGTVLECNNTLVRALGYRRDELIGRPLVSLLPEPRRGEFIERFAEFLRIGSLEMESRWEKANGEFIDVWVTSTAVLGADGTFRHSRSVAQDVTARRALEAELHEKNERLARANLELSRKNRELDEFTYVVSHDLQEPLRTLIAFSDFLLKDYGDRLDDNGRENIRFLVEASRRMRALIDDLLNLSRAGRVTADFAPVALEPVLDEVRSDLAELIRSRHAEVRVAGPLPVLWGDRVRIRQLFANLISNGLKYNKSEPPRVEIAASLPEAPGSVTIAVRDNGIGIDPQFHAKIFQLFRRLHRREEYEGTGAGLAICLKIVQGHGGNIRVESQPGAGAIFFVTLPHPPPDASPLRTEVLYAP